MTFKVIVLGCSGGPYVNNMSGYLLSPRSTNQFITLDAGTLLSSIVRVCEKGHFNDLILDHPTLLPQIVFFQKYIKAYLISHAHLDHILALVINSQDDTVKPIYALEPTINTLRDHVFNYKVWPNFGNEGESPLEFYTYHRLKLHEKTPLAETGCTVEAFELNHSYGCDSSAFLIEYQNEYVLYFGDTGADSDHEKKHHETIWKRIAPLIREKKMRGIFLECSYISEYKGPAQRAHLNPKSMMESLGNLERIAGAPVSGLKVIVTHRKESTEKKIDAKEKIAQELLALNKLKVDFIFPTQDDKLLL